MVADFMDNAKGLTKNPLGIIALFISLIYGFSCIVLSASLNNLCGPEERLPLIWFIILFPILILIVFTILVMFHHKKLYAPSDYKDEKNFMNTLINSMGVTSDLEKTREKVDSLLKEDDKEKIRETLNSISSELERIKTKSERIPINKTWRLNHWGSNCATIVGNNMIFEGTSAPNGDSDGSHIDLIDALEIGKSYEVSCFAKSNDKQATSMFQLWCHDKTAEPNGVSAATTYKTPSISGETIKLNFKADYNKNIRIHLQFKPGQGRIEVSDVRLSELKE